MREIIRITNMNNGVDYAEVAEGCKPGVYFCRYHKKEDGSYALGASRTIVAETDNIQIELSDGEVINNPNVKEELSDCINVMHTTIRILDKMDHDVVEKYFIRRQKGDFTFNDTGYLMDFNGIITTVAEAVLFYNREYARPGWLTDRTVWSTNGMVNVFPVRHEEDQKMHAVFEFKDKLRWTYAMMIHGCYSKGCPLSPTYTQYGLARKKYTGTDALMYVLESGYDDDKVKEKISTFKPAFKDSKIHEFEGQVSL